MTEKTEVHISEETEKAAEESVDHLQQENVHEDLALTTALPKTAAEPEPQLKPEDIEIQEEDESKQSQKDQMVESETDASALKSVSADQSGNLSQTPETESWAGPFTDPAGVSEEGKDEDTEVSAEMARISHAPKVAWEENKTIAEDEKDDASEMDVRSENISESHTDAYGDAENDNDMLKSSHISVNTNLLGSSFLEQGTLDLDFGYHDDLMKVDEQDNVSNISEEVTEQMDSETEAAIDSINEWDRQEETEPENETKMMSPDSDVEEEDEMNIDANTKDKTEDENVTEREEEEIEVIKSDISVQDEGVDHQESLENTIPPTEAHSDQIVNEEDPLPEESEGEEENQGEDDDSPNISASCRTDPGECDSYSQENTLADPRPLIHYKSDEETDGNMQASHLIGETSDSEDEKERMEGGHWNESASKRFNTMEDLTEEPDMDVTGEMMTEVVSKEEALDGDKACLMLQSDSEVHESLDMVEKESSRIALKGDLEDDNDVMTEMRKDEDHDVKVYEQNEQPQLTENQHIHTEQPEMKQSIHMKVKNKLIRTIQSHSLKHPSSLKAPLKLNQL